MAWKAVPDDPDIAKPSMLSPWVVLQLTLVAVPRALFADITAPDRTLCGRESRRSRRGSRAMNDR